MKMIKKIFGPKRHQTLDDQQSCPIQIGYRDFLQPIVVAVRREAVSVPAFRNSHNGCIRITAIPLCRAANEWMGGFRTFHTWLEGNDQDTCSLSLTYKIDPQGSYIVRRTFEDGHIEPVNCCGCSALKTAWALEKHEMRNSFSEPYLGYFVESNGWSMEDGAVCTTVMLNDQDFVCLCVCVSGAESSDDARCSLAGMIEAEAYFERYAESVSFSPHINWGKLRSVK